MIVLVSGKMGSGKSAFAKYLVDNERAEVRRFADPVYQIARDVFGMIKKDRNLLQGIGAKMREIDPEVYAKAFVRRVRYGDDRLVVADDLRFPNEFDMAKRVFGSDVVTVRITADHAKRLAKLEELYGEVTPEQLNDVSETALDGYVMQGRFDVSAFNSYETGFFEEVWERVQDRIKCAGEG